MNVEMKIFFVTFLMLLLFSGLFLIVVNSFDGASAKVDLDGTDIYVVTHINDELEPEVIRSMIDELEVVTGIQLCVWVGDSSTGGIRDSRGSLETWMKEFTDFKIVIQCDYAFENKYGYYQRPFWVYEDTETLSQTWYNNWYGNLSQVLNQYPNVVLMVGFNEPYNHFKTKEMAQTIIKREYTTWKKLSKIPFSTEFLMPRIFWADYWNFPQNITIEADLVPFWTNYSDYIGVNLWAYNNPPQYHYSSGVYERAVEVIETCEYYSNELGKPIHVNEFPAWSSDVFRYTFEKVCKPPNIGQVYQLWYWSGSEDAHLDGWSYGLYNIDSKTHQVSRAKPSWYIFRELLMPHQILQTIP